MFAPIPDNLLPANLRQILPVHLIRTDPLRQKIHCSATFHPVYDALRLLAEWRGREISVDAAEAYDCMRFVI